MHKLSIIIFSVFFILFSSFETNKKIPNTSFDSGENLTYEVYYGWVVGGKASLTVRELDNNGTKIYHAKAKATSTGITRKLYTVDDVYQSFIVAETGKPIKAIRDISEDTYKYYNEVYFYHDKNMVNSQKSGKHTVPSNMHDMLSAFYYGRRILFDDLVKGDVVTINTYFEDEVFPLKIRYKGIETIKTSVGKVNCLRFNPVVEAGRIFDTEDDVNIWISNDKNHIPIRVQFDLIIGSVKCDLVEYKGLKNNFAIL